MADMVDWLEFGIELSGTLIGAGVGFGLAIWWDRRKRNSEIKETKNHTINSIVEELKEIPSSLKDFDVSWDKTKGQFLGGYILISSPAFESAVNSGNFSLLSPVLQSELGKVYFTMERCNSIMDQILKFYSATAFTSTVADIEATKLSQDLKQKISELREGINKVLPELEKAKCSVNRHRSYPYRHRQYSSFVGVG